MVAIAIYIKRELPMATQIHILFSVTKILKACAVSYFAPILSKNICHHVFPANLKESWRCFLMFFKCMQIGFKASERSFLAKLY